MGIREAFDKALARLKAKAGIISQVAVDAEKEIKEKKIPRYPDKPSGAIYYNPDVHTDHSHGIAMEHMDNKALLQDDRCAECDLKKKQIRKETIEEAINKVFEDLNALTDEEFQAELEKHKEEPECNPKTCWGECMGEGWCHIAQEWQKKIHHHHVSFVKYVQVNKVRGKRSKKKRKELKRKWKQIHNQRRRK